MSAIAAELLVRARERAGMSQRELARHAGFPQSVISAYERDRRDPTVSTLQRLLLAAGHRLAAVPVRQLDEQEAGRQLGDLLALADHLPRHPDIRARKTKLRYPRLVVRRGGNSDVSPSHSASLARTHDAGSAGGTFKEEDAASGVEGRRGARGTSATGHH